MIVSVPVADRPAGIGWLSSEKVRVQLRGKFGDVKVKCGVRFTFAWFVIVTVFVFSPMLTVPHLKGIEAVSLA